MRKEEQFLASKGNSDVLNYLSCSRMWWHCENIDFQKSENGNTINYTLGEG